MQTDNGKSTAAAAAAEEEEAKIEWSTCDGTDSSSSTLKTIGASLIESVTREEETAEEEDKEEEDIGDITSATASEDALLVARKDSISVATSVENSKSARVTPKVGFSSSLIRLSSSSDTRFCISLFVTYR